MNETLQVVNAIITDEAGRSLLLHRNTPSLKHWEFPGGPIDAGESGRDALHRQTFETTGLNIEVVDYLDRTKFLEEGRQLECAWYSGRVLMRGRPKIKKPEIHDSFMYVDISRPRLAAYYQLSLSVEGFVRWQRSRLSPDV